jgi:glucosamine-6-phosphate deaminase
VREVDWTDQKAKRAVIWLSETLDKPIPRLEAADYYQNQLHGLVHRYDHVDDLAREVFEDLRQRITYREQLIADERVIVFSPHPDDDVISMGGMLDKLVANDNDVSVAYMTNGSVAVFDADVRRYLRFVGLSGDTLGLGDSGLEGFEARREEIETFLAEKDPGEVDPSEVQTLKAHIRYGEAIAAIEVMGLDGDDAEFLDMPFYKTGRVRKDPISEADVEVVYDLLTAVEPTHIFVAGDLSDPHGTHRMCYKAIKEALQTYNEDTASPAGDGVPDEEAVAAGTRPRPLVWLYRGAWQEWPLDEADVFVPLSKADLDRKVEAIFKHESQKDRAMFPGAYDEREFWERARDRNRGTADALDGLGLPEFYAAEAFVTTDEMP